MSVYLCSLIHLYLGSWHYQMAWLHTVLFLIQPKLGRRKYIIWILNSQYLKWKRKSENQYLINISACLSFGKLCFKFLCLSDIRKRKLLFVYTFMPITWWDQQWHAANFSPLGDGFGSNCISHLKGWLRL